MKEKKKSDIKTHFNALKVPKNGIKAGYERALISEPNKEIIHRLSVPVT